MTTKKYILLSFILFANFLHAQNVTTRLDSLFQALYKDQKFYGNVLVADKDKIIYQQSFGKANHQTNENLNAESIFELASVSKQFTAMGIMLLKKEGKLTYEDSLRKFFPELPYHNITVRHLLNHTSGLPDYMELFATAWDSTKIATNKDIIAIFAKEKPASRFIPGEKWEYSNTGYALLASILEKVSGMSFGKYLDKNIFKPLEMNHSLVFQRRYEKRSLPNYAYGYLKGRTGEFVLPDDVPDVAAMVYSLDGIVGDGTVNSTTGDLFKWDRALYTEKLVSKEMMEEAFTPVKLNNETTFNYGFGWGLSRTVGGRTVSHSGGWPGYSTFIERHIENGKTIILLRNHQTGAEFPVKSIRNILYNVVDTTPKEVSLPATQLAQYTGEYELAPNFSITVTVENGKIFAQATGQQKFEIFYEKEDLFFLKVVQAKLKFTRDAARKITGLILYQNGQEVEGVKK